MPPSNATMGDTAADNVVSLPASRVRAAVGKMGGRLGGIFAPDGYEHEFLPAAVEVLETPPSPLGRAVALAISAFVAIALLWATIGEICGRLEGVFKPYTPSMVF